MGPRKRGGSRSRISLWQSAAMSQRSTDGRMRALSELGRRTSEPPISWLMERALTHPHLISLAAGFTDNATLPLRETARIIRGLLAARRSGEPALQYGNTAGLKALRELTISRMRKLEGRTPGADAVYDPANLLITHGSQQLLYLATEVLCDPGDIVVLEDPTYFVYLGIAQSHGLECRGVPLDEHGVRVVDFEKVLAQLKRSGRIHRLKLAYLVTYYQNPTGTTTNFDRKAAVLDLLRHYEKAAGHPLYLLEDAAYRELHFAGAEVPSALSVRGRQERIIHTSTYSKPFATGVRVGYAWLPKPLREPITRVKGNHDFGTSSFLQHLMAEALRNGTYESHLGELRRRYQRKAQWMTDAARKRFPAVVQWGQPLGGMYVWAVLPPRVRTGLGSRLFREALQADVLYVPGSLCYAPDPTRSRPDHEMRLSYGSAGRAGLEEGIARLGAAIADRLV